MPHRKTLQPNAPAARTALSDSSGAGFAVKERFHSGLIAPGIGQQHIVRIHSEDGAGRGRFGRKAFTVTAASLGSGHPESVTVLKFVRLRRSS
jgi:hypothetical protein